MSKFSVIWKEVYRRNVKSGGFMFMVLSPIIFIAVGFFVGNLINNETNNATQAKISIVSTESNLKNAVENAPLAYQFIPANHQDDAVKKLANDEISGYVVLSRTANNSIKADFYTKATSNAVSLKPLKEVLTVIATQEIALEQGITPNQLQHLTNVSIETSENKLDVSSLKEGVVKLSDNSDMAKDTLRRGFAYVVVILMFIFVMNYASTIGQEIATEKGTRMMEVVLSSTTAKTHFYGKLFGIVMVLLTQVAIYVAMAVPSYFLFDGVKDTIAKLIPNVDLLGSISDMVIASVVYMILGILLYVTISAMLGSIVSRVEDVQKAMSPIILIGMGGYFIGLFSLGMPNNLVVRFGSLFPLFTPFIMPFRLAAGTVDMMELIMATVFTLLTSILILFVSVKMYRSNILIYSDKGMFKAFKQSLALQREHKQKHKQQ